MHRAHKNEIQRIEKALSALVKDEPELASKVEKLTAFQGVGKTTAFAVLANAPKLGTLSRGQISALAGLCGDAKTEQAPRARSLR